jgi:acyl-CoA thioester hydrolase
VSEPSEAFSNEHTIDVVAEKGDIDENGHVSNLVYLRWVQDAAIAHSTAVGWDHAAYKRVGAAFFVVRHEIDYLGAAFEGETLKVTTVVTTWSAATSERRTRIVRASDDKLLARCVTKWAFVGLNGRPRRIIPEVVEAFRRR